MKRRASLPPANDADLTPAIKVIEAAALRAPDVNWTRVADLAHLGLLTKPSFYRPENTHLDTPASSERAQQLADEVHETLTKAGFSDPSERRRVLQAISDVKRRTGDLEEAWSTALNSLETTGRRLSRVPIVRAMQAQREEYAAVAGAVDLWNTSRRARRPRTRRAS